MTRQHKIFGIGIAIYVASFFLPAISGPVVTSPSGSAPGYICAWYAFIQPFGGFDGYFGHRHLEYFSLMAGGWINPIFFTATILALSGRRERLLATLRTAVLLMIPFCWIVYFEEDSYPREGHVLWIAGMLLVLFSVKLGARKKQPSAPLG
jgi:uncharacterized membrane protein (UPF0136 family)